ncbi:MAG: Gfo/Idh/MocA family oxidoreductase [Gammaproteobacteria bacterium]|nr:Gfo/Idh/MocA family oxidoreductase [Gammaproteobacteria bacterium]
MSDDRTLKLALVGCGGIARAHLDGIRRIAKRVQVTACIDSDLTRAEEFARQTSSEPFTSLEEGIEKGTFDAVDLMLPHDAHEAACYTAFKANKHTILEKPISTDVPSAERILEAGKNTDVVFMVAEQAQYWWDVHKARELIESGAIGQVLTAHGTFYDPMRLDPYGPIPWRYRQAEAGGGVCMDGGAHWIRPMRIMLGEVDEVIASTGSHIEHRETESFGLALMRFQSGVIATFKAVLISGRIGPEADFRITGSDGEIVLERGRNGRLMLYNHNHPKGQMVMDTFKAKVDSYGAELEDFEAAVLDGRPLAAGPEVAMGELRTAQAMYRSETTRSWEKVW